MGKVINLEKGSDKPDITVLPKSTYQAVISAVWDIGTHKGEWKGVETVNEKIMIRFEVNKLIEDEGDFKGKRYNLLKEINIPKFFGEKAGLVMLTSAAFGREMLPKDFEGFDTDSLIGKNVMIATGHTKKNGDKGGNAKIESFSTLMDILDNILPELSPDMPDWVKGKSIEGGVQLDESATSADPSNSSSGGTLYNEPAPDDSLPF